MKKFFRTLFFPPLFLLVALSVLSGLILLTVFFFHWEHTFLAYAMYLCSAWALVAWCARGVLWLKKKWNGILERFPGLAKYWNDIQFRAEVSIWFTFALNTAFSFYKAYLGVACHSFWFGSVAMYYITLSVMRFLLLRQITQNRGSWKTEMEHYRGCGYCLLVLTFALSIMVYVMIKENTASTYPGHLIYITAGYTFYNFYLAIHNVLKYRKLNNPVISASKYISLACALVSVFTLQAAMLLQFGNDAVFQHTMNVWTAAVTFSVIFILSLFMILKSTVLLLRDEQGKAK